MIRETYRTDGEKKAQAFTPIWYTIPQFVDVVPLNLYHKEQEPLKISADAQQMTADIPKNLHILARAEVEVERIEAGSCLLDITADDYYKLYVNGRFAGQGPAPAYPEHYYYNTIELAPFLKEGKNVLAVHLYYQGLVNRVWNSGDGRFALAAEIRHHHGALEWKYQVSHAYSGETTGYDTQYLESFDSRLWDVAWKDTDFDDNCWDKMVPAAWADYRLLPQPVKMLSVYEMKPETVIKAGEGHWLIDAGQEVTGSLFLTAKGSPGSKAVILYGEELDEVSCVRFPMRCNCAYREEWTLAEGLSSYIPYDYKGFRYVEIFTEDFVELNSIRIQVRHYPLDEEACVFRTSAPCMEDIFRICRQAVKLGTQEGYLDCPTREKGQYLGDAVITSRSQVWLGGTVEMLRKCIQDFARTKHICPGLMAVAPGSLMQEIADFSLLWPQLLTTDYQFTGDKEFLKQYYPVAKNLLEHFARYEREDGLLEQVSDKWNLVDWPENLRDNYDFELSRPVVAKGCHNVINALYIGAIKTLCEMEKILRLPQSYDWEKRRKSYIRAFYRSRKKLFADQEKSAHCALHSNLYPLYFGLMPEEAEKPIADFLIKKGFCCGVMTSFYLLKGLAYAGRYEEVYRLLVNPGEHGWVNMLNEGATACFEAWGKEQKWNTSLCHPWASAPISILIEEIAGIHLHPELPGGYRFEPHIPDEIEYFYLKVPFRGKTLCVKKENGKTSLHEEK